MTLAGLRAAVHAPAMAVVTAFGAVVSLISAIFDRSGDTVLALARIWSRVIFFTGGVKIVVSHQSPLDPGQSYVFMANHVSAVDIWALLVGIPVNVRMIAKKQLAKIPLLGWAMTAGRFIFIDRQNPLAARRSIDQAAARIRGGTSVMIFPEGTRSRDGLLGSFKKGGFHLAMNAGVPIVPVAIRGARELMPAGSLTMRAGVVWVEIGTPITTEGLKLDQRPALIERVRDQISRMSGQPKAESTNPSEQPDPSGDAGQ